jgi:hypothetical protein
MARIITKELAEKIAKKLDAKIDKRSNRAHDIALIYYEGRLIADFGIRRGSRDLGHDHVPGNIFLRPHQARLLGQCTINKDGWLEIVRQKGLL